MLLALKLLETPHGIGLVSGLLNAGGDSKVRLRPSVAEFRPSEFRPPSMGGTPTNKIRPWPKSVRPLVSFLMKNVKFYFPGSVENVKLRML